MISFTLAPLDPKIEKQIRSHCEKEYPNEACGAIIGRGNGADLPWQIISIREAANEHGEDRRRRYLVPPDFQAKAEIAARSQGFQVLGYYHSHPDHPALPSEFDRAHAWFGYLYMICAVANGRSTDLASYSLDQDNGVFVTIRS